MKVLRKKVHSRSSSSIHLDYNQPLAGGLSVHSTPARQIGNLSLTGRSTDVATTHESKLVQAATLPPAVRPPRPWGKGA
eukprot:421899-Prymnesium_polylepis.1